jgi:hypothetical protein
MFMREDRTGRFLATQFTGTCRICIRVCREPIGINPDLHEFSDSHMLLEPRINYGKPVPEASIHFDAIDQFVSIGQDGFLEGSKFRHRVSRG